MIPDRLQLRNFMSYGEGVPPLEFAGMRLACLSGDNGNGKTALLDAITWALFDKTRAKEKDAIIRVGASEAAVLFDFYVEETRYRVRRSLSRRGGSVWELQVWQEDGTTRPLSGANSRETGGQIQKLLRMDYETFLATGYLAQGRADEFTRATGGGRKKILADILGLERFERLEKMANERRKDAETLEKDAESEIRAIDEKLSRRDYFEAQLEDAQKRAKDAEVERDTVRAEQDELLARIERLEGEEEKARDYEHRSVEAERDIAAYRQDIATLEAHIRAAQTLLERRPEIEDAYCRHEALTEEGKRLDEEYDEVLKLERLAADLDRRIQEEHRKLDNERYRLETEISTLEREGKELPRLEGEVSRLEASIAEYGDPEAQRQTALEARQEAEDGFIEQKTRHAALKARSEALQTRRDALSGSQSVICDYCGQDLPLERRQAAIAEAEDEQATLAAEMRAVAAAGKECKRRADECRAQEAQAQKDLAAIASLNAQLAQIRQETYRVEERIKGLPDLGRRMDRLAARLSERDYAHQEQEQRVKIAAQLEKTERVAQRRADVRAELEKYRNIGVEMERLRKADEVMQTEPPRVEELTERITKKETSIARARKLIDEIRTRTGELPVLYRDRDALNARLRSAEEGLASASRAIGEFTRELEHCDRLAQERVRREAERQEAGRDRERYRELTAAFSDKGVQALIIGNALPELQNHTNNLLGKMTNGAMQVQLQLQREAKTKGANPIETLDIIISDEMGARPYEMFSGGEAFRINFALRVALSRLLARRAGAPLQTLILDEGFGTQDPRGREAIADAIHNISDDFALVLVITHVEELKEAFPTRIEVVKGPGGSTFTVA